MKSPKTKKVVRFCPLCGKKCKGEKAYDLAAMCVWLHIFWQDEHYKKITSALPTKKSAGKRKKSV